MRAKNLWPDFWSVSGFIKYCQDFSVFAQEIRKVGLNLLIRPRIMVMACFLDE